MNESYDDDDDDDTGIVQMQGYNVSLGEHFFFSISMSMKLFTIMNV